MKNLSITTFNFFQRLIDLCTFTRLLERKSMMRAPGPSIYLSNERLLCAGNALIYFQDILFEDMTNDLKYLWILCIDEFVYRATESTITEL